MSEHLDDSMMRSSPAAFNFTDQQSRTVRSHSHVSLSGGGPLEGQKVKWTKHMTMNLPFGCDWTYAQHECNVTASIPSGGWSTMVTIAAFVPSGLCITLCWIQQWSVFLCICLGTCIYLSGTRRIHFDMKHQNRQHTWARRYGTSTMPSVLCGWRCIV